MKVVALTSDKGGMGKSTAAVNLACAATEEGFEVAVLDLDPQASVGRWSRIRKKAELPSRPVAETCVPIDIEDRLSELRDAGADLVIWTLRAATTMRLWPPSQPLTSCLSPAIRQTWSFRPSALP